MNLGNGKGSVSMVSSGAVCKPAEAVPDQFPAGLRVLVVDDDPTCLTILEMMLKTCLYEVTKCTRAEMALSLLRENRNGYDIVLSDVHMPNMDGFKLLECIGLEMDLPVIMMSADDGKKSVMKGVTLGACDYLIKPVQFEALRNIWQHVVRKKRIEWKDGEQMGSVDEGKRSDDADYSPSSNEGSWKNPRVVWSVELHQQFVQAVNQLGIDKAVPKKILELMNVPGLTRENVASHLQKYRFFLRRLSGVSPHPNSLSNGYMRPQEAAYGSLSSLNGLDLPTRAASGQLPAQSPATLQPARIPGPVVDQRDLFSFDNSKLRFYAQQQQQLLNHTRPVNLPHGIPVNMELNHYNGSYVLQIPEKNIKHEAPSDRGGYDKSWKISSFSFNSPFVPIRLRTIPPICMVIMVVVVVAVVIAMVRFGLARMWLFGEREKRGNLPLWFFRAFEEC